VPANSENLEQSPSGGQELREFIERFRRMLQVRNPANERNLPAQLDRYDRLCREANRRLRECFALIQRGRYANAVANAELDPNLIDLCTQLEFPERDWLASAAQTLGVAAPELIHRELFSALQDAYNKGSTVAENLRLLHQLTLARAPLPTRLAVMRRLVVQNPNHPFLDTDIRAFERAWFKQAVGFAQGLAKQGRTQLIEEILQDLREGGYLETPPSGPMSQLEALLPRARVVELEQLTAEIRKVFAEDAYDKLRPLVVRWEAILATGAGPVDEVKLGIREALDHVRRSLWAEQRQVERDETREELWDLIATPGISRLDLETVYQKAVSLGGVDAELQKAYRHRMGEAGRTRLMVAGGVVAGVIFIAGLLVLGNSLNPRPARPVSAPQSGSPATGPTEAFARALQDLANCPPERDAAPLIAAARAHASSAQDRQAVDRVEQAWNASHEKWMQERKDEFERLALKLKVDSEGLLAVARQWPMAGWRRTDAGALKAQLSKLRDQAHSSGYRVADLNDAERALAEIAKWSTLSEDFDALRKELETTRGPTESFGHLASFLADKVAVVAPDPKLAERAKLAKVALPTWLKSLEVQEALQSTSFLAHAVDSTAWAQQPPSGALAAAAEYAEMLKHRDADARDSIASHVKKRLGAVDIVGLWTVRTGEQSLPWYTKEKTKDGDERPLSFLISRTGQVLRLDIGSRRIVERAPQSVFAERAARLWGLVGRAQWHARLAETYDELLDSPKLEPLLKLELVRSFLQLASRSSIGYRQILEGQDAYRTLTGEGAAIPADWISAAEEEAVKPLRKRAEDLLKQAPHLRPLATEAAARDERRLQALRQGFVAFGWISRDDKAKPAIVTFRGAKPSPGSRLYTSEGQKWIDLGTVGDDGAVRVNDDASLYVGWPAFSIFASP
jgi:hypothetical protein